MCDSEDKAISPAQTIRRSSLAQKKWTEFAARVALGVVCHYKFDRANHIYIIALGEVSTYVEQSIPNPHALNSYTFRAACGSKVSQTAVI